MKSFIAAATLALVAAQVELVQEGAGGCDGSEYVGLFLDNPGEGEVGI